MASSLYTLVQYTHTDSPICFVVLLRPPIACSWLTFTLSTLLSLDAKILLEKFPHIFSGLDNVETWMLGFARCVNMQSRKIWVEMEASNRIHIYWDWSTSKPLCLPHNLSKSRLYCQPGSWAAIFFTANCSHSIRQHQTKISNKKQQNLSKNTSKNQRKMEMRCTSLRFYSDVCVCVRYTAVTILLFTVLLPLFCLLLLLLSLKPSLSFHLCYFILLLPHYQYTLSLALTPWNVLVNRPNRTLTHSTK